MIGKGNRKYMRKRKIGILSMQRIVNYGSFMQALGLKILIESWGYEVVFVDYHVGNYFSKKNIKNTLLYKRIREILSFLKPIEINEQADALKSQYNILGLEKKYHYRTKVDTLIIGSDEVFNYIQKGECVRCSPELLGANNRAGKVISYAASCGNLSLKRLEKNNKVEEFRYYVSKISTISVRDKNTYDLVYNLTGIKPFMHLDPVLISDFSNFATDNVNMDNYILVYGYTDRFTEEEGKAICMYAEKMGKNLYSLGGKQSFCEKNICCPPLEVLAYFHHADLIITDTFHGTIFSIVTERNVVVIVRDGEEGNVSKLNYLLAQLDIEYKKLNSIEQLETIIEYSINYDKIHKLRKREREKSINYLKHELEEN